MFEAAHDADVDPDRVSFVAALRITRRSLHRRGFSPLGALITAGLAPWSSCAVASTRSVDTDRTHD